MNIHSASSQVWINDIERYIDELYPYHQEGKLKMPLFFIRFLHAMLCSSSSICTERAYVYGVATTLLKIGLDMHIQDHHKTETVLAGDCLSIQFYCMLSQQGEVEGIRHISKAISEINEWNMEYHLWLQQGAPYGVAALQSVQRISSALVLSVANLFLTDLQLGYWAKIIPCAFILNEVHAAQFQLTADGKEFVKGVWIELTDMILSLRSMHLKKKLCHLFESHFAFVLIGGNTFEDVSVSCPR